MAKVSSFQSRWNARTETYFRHLSIFQLWVERQRKMLGEKCEYYAAILLQNRRKETKIIFFQNFKLNGEGREKG